MTCEYASNEGTCEDWYNCCDCEDGDCGCGYCWSCNACENCLFSLEYDAPFHATYIGQNSGAFTHGKRYTITRVEHKEETRNHAEIILFCVSKTDEIIERLHRTDSKNWQR